MRMLSCVGLQMSPQAVHTLGRRIQLLHETSEFLGLLEAAQFNHKIPGSQILYPGLTLYELEIHGDSMSCRGPWRRLAHSCRAGEWLQYTC